MTHRDDTMRLVTPAFAIRPAEFTDIAAITLIYAHAVEHGTATFELLPPDESEMRRRFEALKEKAFPYLVADLGGSVVGYAYAAPYRPREAYRYSVEDSVYIDPAMHRRGMGRVLLDRLIAESEQRGFRQMVAVIGDSEQAPSIELHRAAGFRMIGTIEHVGYKFGRWLDTVIMQRGLGAGAASDPD